MSTLKQELDAELSQLVHEYEDRGLAADEISDSLAWHIDLVETRSTDDCVLSADD